MKIRMKMKEIQIWDCGFGISVYAGGFDRRGWLLV